MADITIKDALSELFPWIGGGGLTALGVAWLGYLRGHRRQPEHSVNLAALYTDRLALERTANSLVDLARAFDAGTDAERENSRILVIYIEALRDNTEAMKDLARSNESRARRGRD